MRRWWVLAPLALIAAGLCIWLGLVGRYGLNPDGVSYLDLALQFRAGDWAHFIQGYWSPLYPVLIAAIATVTGARDVDLVPWVHAFDMLLAVGMVAIICWLAWRLRNLWLGIVGLPLLLLSSGRLPRLEVITPDILLAFLLTLAAAELLVHGTRRRIWLGVLFGLCYLAKTSCWPWLVASLVFALLAARGREERLALLRIAGTGVLVMSCWLVPLAIRSGTPTFGSAARLNYQWYIAHATSQMPEDHIGGHRRYQEIRIDSATTATVAVFADGPSHYQPWGDPTGWDAEITDYGYATNRLTWSARALDDFKTLLLVWSISVTVAVLLPLLLASYRRGMLRQLWREERAAMWLVLCGALAIGQFLMVHTEPRLIAPFVLVASLGVAVWLTRRPGGEPGAGRLILGSTLGWLWAIAMALNVISRQTTAAQEERAAQVDTRAAVREVTPNTDSGPAVVLLGQAGIAMLDLWREDAHAVAQVIRPRTKEMQGWTNVQRQALVDSLRRFRPDQIWVVLPNGKMAIVPAQ